jgi:hypothetical protein
MTRSILLGTDSVNAALRYFGELLSGANWMVNETASKLSRQSELCEP